MKQHPLLLVVSLFILGVLGMIIPQILFYVMMPLVLLLFIYNMIVMIGDNMYKSRTGWYEKNRCPTCGHFVETNND